MGLTPPGYLMPHLQDVRINCRTTCYIDQMGAWYDSRTKQEVMNLLILKQLQQAVGSFGLTGLDKLLSFMIVKELQV